MKRLLYLALMGMLMVTFTGCKENYSVGEKVGNLIEFTKKGVIWDSWEGRMNLTQTGMNTSGAPFQFSFDNDRDDQDSLVQLLYQAQVEGWKVKLKYHAVWCFKNVFSDRGDTDYFVDDVETGFIGLAGLLVCVGMPGGTLCRGLGQGGRAHAPFGDVLA